MNLNPDTMESLAKECLDIQAFLEITCSDDGNEIAIRGHDVSVYLARTGKMVSDAKYHLNIAKQAAFNLHSNKGFSPSVLKDVVNSHVAKEQALFDWTERLNKSCTHQLDWLRSALSKAKEELRNLNH